MRLEMNSGEMSRICDDRDRPHRAGDRYCSPSCGFGCTYAAYERAVAEGKALAARLGLGWEVRVWENCGWNYSAQNGDHTVHVRREGSSLSGYWSVSGYWASVNASSQAIGESLVPELALEAALNVVRARVAADMAALRRFGDFGPGRLTGVANDAAQIEAAQ